MLNCLEWWDSVHSNAHFYRDGKVELVIDGFQSLYNANLIFNNPDVENKMQFFDSNVSLCLQASAS